MSGRYNCPEKNEVKKAAHANVNRLLALADWLILHHPHAGCVVDLISTEDVELTITEEFG